MLLDKSLDEIRARIARRDEREQKFRIECRRKRHRETGKRARGKSDDQRHDKYRPLEVCGKPGGAAAATVLRLVQSEYGTNHLTDAAQNAPEKNKRDPV